MKRQIGPIAPLSKGQVSDWACDLSISRGSTVGSDVTDEVQVASRPWQAKLKNWPLS